MSELVSHTSDDSSKVVSICDKGIGTASKAQTNKLLFAFKYIQLCIKFCKVNGKGCKAFTKN